MIFTREQHETNITDEKHTKKICENNRIQNKRSRHTKSKSGTQQKICYHNIKRRRGE